MVRNEGFKVELTFSHPTSHAIIMEKIVRSSDTLVFLPTRYRESTDPWLQTR